MCWKCPASRSIWRRAWCRMWRVLSNLSPDHIDRHGTMENYAAIKARLMKQTARDGQVVIGVDDSHASAIFTQLSASGGAQAYPVSVGKILGRGVFVVDGALYDATGARAVKVMDMAAARPSARRAQLAECGAGLLCGASLHLRHQGDRRRHRQLSRAWPIAWKMSAISARRSSSTTPRPPMPMPRRGRWRSIPIFSGSRAASPRKAASKAWPASFPASARPI